MVAAKSGGGATATAETLTARASTHAASQRRLGVMEGGFEANMRTFLLANTRMMSADENNHRSGRRGTEDRPVGASTRHPRRRGLRRTVVGGLLDERFTLVEG